MFLRNLIVAAVAAAAASGCGPSATKRACMGGSAQSPLVTDAAMVRLDVYGATAHCIDGMLAAGAGAPIQSHSYEKGQPITLDVPPGPHALVLSTFADANGTQLLGVGCTEATLQAGSQICFDLTIEPAPDAGGDDLSSSVCSQTPDDCPTGSYCDGVHCMPGCKRDSDCPKDDAGLGACNPTTHTCAECAVDSDCGTAPGAACCAKRCVNLKSDPLNCNGCGTACTGANTQCCNGACSNPNTDANNCGGCGTVCNTLNAASAACGGGACSWTCNRGYAHCMAGNSGCDTNLVGSNEKLCGTMCVPLASCCTASDCATPPAPSACYGAGVCSGVGGTCSYPLKSGSKVCGATCCNAMHGSCNVDCTLTCDSGYADCDGDRSNGCETNLAMAGEKVCGAACIPATSCCSALDCMTPPTPAACYSAAGSCPAPGGTCAYTENTGSQICGTTCCNAMNGTCTTTCGLNCAGGFLDCNGNPTDGCETGCAPAHATGACASGMCAIGSCNGGFLDCNGSVSDGCECGTSCCTNPTTSMPGCLTTHSNGQGGNYTDCYALATPGKPSTYDVNMALDAAASDTAQAGTASTGWTCGAGTNSVTSVCKTTGNGNTGTCTCWAYASGGSASADAIVGHTYANPSTNGCLCQQSTDPTWN